MNKNILIIGTDNRFKYTQNYLIKNGYSVFIATSKEEIIKQADKSGIIVLPLPVSRDGINLNNENEKITLNEVLSVLNKDQLITGGMMNGKITDLFTFGKRKPKDYYNQSDVTKANSVLTAEATAGIIINRLPFGIYSSKIAVTGYGHSASEISKMLLKLNAEITVTARSEKALTEAGNDGMNTCPLSRFNEICNNFDVIINTVPALIIDESIIKNLKKNCTIIEIASAPFGTDFSTAQKYSINVIKASALPGKTSPETAGIIIAESLLKIIKGDEDG